MARARIHLTPAEAEANGWLCCRDLKARHRLMPGYSTRPAGSVWQGRGAYDVYDPADCVPWKWEPSAAQLRRKAVAARAQALIGGDCLLLDTETTGVGDDDEVCEITILDASGTPYSIRWCARLSQSQRRAQGFTASPMTWWPPRRPGRRSQSNTPLSFRAERSLPTTPPLTCACYRKPTSATGLSRQRWPPPAPCCCMPNGMGNGLRAAMGVGNGAGSS